MESEACYPIKVAARRSGLSAHVVRIWERRYAAVTPARTPTQRRLYSDDDVERLTLLRRATEAGHTISRVATLPVSDLAELLQADAEAAVATARRDGDHRALAAGLVTRPDDAWRAALDATHALDARQLEAVLTQAAIAHSQPILLERIIVPLLNAIGADWREGKLRPAHEHLASAVIRGFLASLSGASAVHEAAPVLVLTTPLGQLHEMGAMLAAATATAEGWRVTYLGPNLPAADVAAAARQAGARAVALSIVYPTDDPRVGQEIARLRAALPAAIEILIGGRAARGYEREIAASGAIQIHDLPALRATLERLRGAAR